MGFSRQRRIRRRAEFRKIQGEGQRVVTRSFFLLLHAREPTDPPFARLGITASKRVGNAVARNRVKRVVREAFRRSGSLFEAGLDVVVIARPPARDLSPEQVLEEWQGAASRLRKAAQQAAARQAAREDEFARENGREPRSKPRTIGERPRK